jgi:riboflavin biosynthesis pyrimidine reductase
MPDDGAGIQLTVLGSTDSVEDGRLADLYAYPDNLQSCWVRGNMITSLDGGAADDGKSGGLAGPGDRAVFVQMREAADVVLVGAATVRVENYAGAQLSVAARQERQRRGQAEVPPIAIVTRSGDLDPTALVFTRTEVPPLILTCTRSLDDTRSRLGAVADVIDASGPDPDSVDPASALRVLAERRLFRVLSEGGPSLLGLLIENGLLNELCLTAAPILVGGAARRIVTGPGQVHTRMRRTHVLTDDDGYLYTRYVRAT